MGLFSGKKTIIVSSTVYNMAGPELDRPDFLKNSIYAAVISPFNPFLGTTIVSNYLAGPGIGQRNFFRWAERQAFPGLPVFSASREDAIDPAVVAPFIPTPGSPVGLVVQVQSADLISGGYEHFVEQHVLANFPANFNTAYVTSLNPDTNDVTIQWFGGGTEVFNVGTYSPSKTYIAANYYHFLPSATAAKVVGSTTVGVLTKPSTTGYTLDASVNTGVVNYPMNFDERVITTYVGAGAPPDTDVSTPMSDSVNFDGLDETWTKITFEGGDGDTEETVNREHFLEISEYRQVYTDDTQVSLVVNPDTPIVGVTETIETRRVNDHARPIWDWRIDTQDTTLRQNEGGSLMYIYEIGTTEPVLDALFEELTVTGVQGEYFPFIPIHLNNVPITDPIYDDITGSGLYKKSNTAYRRASGGGERFSKLVQQVEDNPDIGDVDFAFTHHGVVLNVIEPACRRYMYEWFKNISVHQTTTTAYMPAYQAAVATYVNKVNALNAWIAAQADSGDPAYGTARPVFPELETLKTATIRLAVTDPQLDNLDMRVSWVNIDETFHTGALTNPDTGLAAIEGDIWIEEATPFTWEVSVGLFPFNDIKGSTVEQTLMIKQTGANSYSKLTMWGLVHRNYVYGGEAVTTTVADAMAATIDLPEGFIIPLHLPTVLDLGIKDATQMATANTFIVFNSFEVVKSPWYTSFVGMVIIIIVIIVLAVIFAPAGAGAGGILGSNAAVGAALGLTGTAALVAGAIANALVAIAISQIVTVASTTVFGEKWGPVIAAVVNLVISFGAAGGFEFENVSELMTIENGLKIAAAAANGYDGYVKGSIAEMDDELQESADAFKDESEKILALINSLNRTNDLNFNPLALTDSVRGNDSATGEGGYVSETLDGFIRRTLMTGTDLVEINLSLIENFTDLNLVLPKQ